MRIALNPKNEYYLEPNEFLETRYFCFQYADLKIKLDDLDGSLSAQVLDGMPHSLNKGDPLFDIYIKRENLRNKIEIIESTAIELTGKHWQEFLKGVTNKDSKFENLNLPITKKFYNKLRRKFYYKVYQKKN